MTPLPAPIHKQIIHHLASQYRVLGILGQGGAGTVYEVENLGLRRREALKVLGEALGIEARERFLHEARTCAALDHPGIVRIHDVGEALGLPWYTMQRVEGHSLARLMDSGIGDGAACRLILDVAATLAYSHSRGVIHRDLKPGNILVDAQGRALLADFGIAKSLDNPVQTRTGHMVGTPAYMAPEQALGQPVDGRSDQYALALTLYRLLARTLPFAADASLETLLQRLQQDPEPLVTHRPTLPELSAFLHQALAREPQDRWEDMTAFGDGLRRACARQGLDLAEPLPTLPAPVPAPLEPDEVAPWALDSTLVNLHRDRDAATTDLPTAALPTRLVPQPVSPGRRLLPMLIPAAILVAIGMGVFLRPGRRVPSPVPGASAQLPPPDPAPESPPKPLLPPRPTTKAAPEQDAPKVAPAPNPSEAPRRPVTYPQLLQAPTPTSIPKGCGGRHTNLSLTIGTEGQVLRCRVLTPLPPECEALARQLAQAYRFRPALDAQGQPVEATVAIALDFPETP